MKVKTVDTAAIFTGLNPDTAAAENTATDGLGGGPRMQSPRLVWGGAQDSVTRGMAPAQQALGGVLEAWRANAASSDDGDGDELLLARYRHSVTTSYIMPDKWSELVVLSLTEERCTISIDWRSLLSTSATIRGDGIPGPSPAELTLLRQPNGADPIYDYRTADGALPFVRLRVVRYPAPFFTLYQIEVGNGQGVLPVTHNALDR